VLNGGVRRGIALVAGLAFPFAFAPFGQFWLAIAALGVLFWLWETSPREAAWLGLFFGLGAFGFGTHWLYHSVRTIGGTPLPVAIPLLAALVAILAAYVALCGYLAARFRPRSHWLASVFFIPALWVLIEWARGWLLSGFPWLAAGYSGIDGPLRAWAPVAGVYGVSLATAIVAGTLPALAVGAARDRRIAGSVLFAVTLATWGVTGRSWTAPAGNLLRVALVQGAIPQAMKWRPEEQLSTLARYQLLTLELADAELVVWPEAAIPAPDDLVPTYLRAMTALAHERNQQLLVGVLTHDAERDEYRNSLRALGEPAGVYHKRHLVPFGEYFPVPSFVRSWLRLMSLPYEDITAGDARQEPLVAHGTRIAPTICYEDIFGDEQRVFLPESGLLVNVSNDAWFGDSIAPHQHLQMARMRALETGRYMLRSTNTGITAIIDEQGHMLKQAPQFKPFVLLGRVQPFAGATPYVRFGDYPVLMLATLLIGAGSIFPFVSSPKAVANARAAGE
jgi:apolipoprotein N-acyltransferase